MVLERTDFALSAIGETLLVASGGFGNGPLSSVEVWEEAGWRLEPKLEMGSNKYRHCSVVVGSWLYTMGGIVDDHYSNLVGAIDTNLLSTKDSIPWVKKASMLDARWNHGCHAGVFEGQEGIYVAGGANANGDLTSAEFYNLADDKWQYIGSLNVGRTYSPMTMLGGTLIVSGGQLDYHLPTTSVETWDGSKWVELNNLMVGRAYHAAVSIKAGKLSCV